MKIDQNGTLYVSGAGGLWIISSEGKHLGTIIGHEHPHNTASGDDDGKTLYLRARTGLYRIRLNVPGIRPPLDREKLAKRQETSTNQSVLVRSLSKLSVW